MAFFINNEGNVEHVQIEASIYKEANDANLSVGQFLNKKFGAKVDASKGTAYQQILASEGLTLPGSNPFGLRAARLADVLDGTSGFQAAGGANTRDSGTPFGSASRTLFPAAIVTMIEAQMDKDRVTDSVVFDEMVASNLSIGSENFEQPVINYDSTGGPQQTRSQRMAQLAEPAMVAKFTTSDRLRRLPVWSFGAEFSNQALKASTLDIVALTMARLMAVERDSHVYEYMSDIWSGDGDLNVGAISAVTTTSLDSTATGGVVTHKSWIKFLARNRKYRQITHVAGDINAYLAVEGRTGRPGSNNYDPTLARIDPQATMVNQGFGNNVRWFLTDLATDGGPVPANTVWALDKKSGIIKVTNTSAALQASEQFAMRQSQALRIDWSEACYRMFGDSELKAFDVLTIS